MYGGGGLEEGGIAFRPSRGGQTMWFLDLETGLVGSCVSTRRQLWCRSCELRGASFMVEEALDRLQGLDNFVERLGLISDAAGLRGTGHVSRRPVPRSGRLQLRDGRRHVDKRGSTKLSWMCSNLWGWYGDFVVCLIDGGLVWVGEEEEGKEKGRPGQGK